MPATPFRRVEEEEEVRSTFLEGSTELGFVETASLEVDVRDEESFGCRFRLDGSEERGQHDDVHRDRERCQKRCDRHADDQ